eukprot:scaffold26949_cov73-Skeletonema_marinoi.AAC.1
MTLKKAYYFEHALILPPACEGLCVVLPKSRQDILHLERNQRTFPVETNPTDFLLRGCFDAGAGAGDSAATNTSSLFADMLLSITTLDNMESPAALLSTESGEPNDMPM